MKKYWWIISFEVHKSGWDGSPDGDSYPVEKSFFKKSFADATKKTYTDFLKNVLNFLKSNDLGYANKVKKFEILCLYGDKEEEKKAEELKTYLKEELGKKEFGKYDYFLKS